MFQSACLFTDTDRDLITPLSRKYSGYVTITHPYHPYCGKKFKILKTFKNTPDKKYFLHLENTNESENFFIPISWTDRAEPTVYNDIPILERPILSYIKLIKLSELISLLKTLEIGG